MSLITNICRFVQYGDLPTGYYTKRGMSVGRNFNRQSNTKFDPSHCWLISIGDDVTISNRVMLIAHDDSIRTKTGYGRVGSISIGNNVFIGAGAFVLAGVTIGDNTVIGAGSVVTHDIPGDSIAMGIPARVTGAYHELIEQAKKEIDANSDRVFDLSWSIYGTPPISSEKKKRMYDILVSSKGYQQLWKYTDGRKSLK